MGKVGKWYREQNHNASGVASLPEFLLVVDDDTMFHIPMLLYFMKGVDPDIPRVWAGCLEHMTMNTRPNRFSPFGGAGTIWSRGAVERAIRPIVCSDKKNASMPSNNSTITSFETQVCARIEQNLINERSLWQDGMSVSDFMFVVYNQRPNCFVSDNLLGHFVNYYYLGNPGLEDDPDFKGMDQARFHLYYDALMFALYSFRNRNETGTTCFVTALPNRCHAEAPICHYVGPETMKNFCSKWL
jgi:hypothetical protein